MSRSGYDAIIVGAGIVGAACAYYAARAGLRVAVVERDGPCAGASGACEGNLLWWDKEQGAEFDLCRLSLDQWEDLARTLPYEFEYHAGKGGVMVVEREESLASAEKRVRWLSEEGVEAEFLDHNALRRREPSLSPELPGGGFFPQDAQVEPRRATIALLRSAADHGAEVRLHEPLTAVLYGAGREVRGLRTPKGELAAASVVLATGAWTGALQSETGVELPVRPRKGHILVLERTRAPVRHKLMEAGYLDTIQSGAADLQVAMVIETTRAGTVVVGSSRNIIGFDRSSQPEVIAAVATRAARFVPALEGLRVLRSYAGLRPFSPDHLPLIGPVPGRPGLFVAAGHEGAGICNSAATGLLISQWLADRPRALPDAGYAPARFTTAGVA